MDANAIRQFQELEQSHFWFAGRRAIFGELLSRELDGRHDLEILDVGCGAGGMLPLLARYGRPRGIDTSAELVEFCHGRGFGEVSLGSATDLPVPDETLDLITLFDTIEHVADDGLVLREVRRALRPGGLVMISVPAYGFLYANNDRVAHHERRYTARELHTKLVAADLRPVQVTYFNTLLFPAILPAVLAKKLIERWVDPGETTNLSHVPAPPVNRALTAIMSSERRLLRRRSFPFGHSLLALARR